MTEEVETARRARLKSDFAYYARNALKIRPKEGGSPISLKLNSAQRHIHEKLEGQKSLNWKGQSNHPQGAAARLFNLYRRSVYLADNAS